MKTLKHLLQKIAAAPYPVPAVSYPLGGDVLTCTQFGSTLKRACDALKAHIDTRIVEDQTSTHERFNTLECTVERVEGSISKILEILQGLTEQPLAETGDQTGAGEEEANTSNADEHTATASSQPQLTTKAELDEISF